MSHPTQPAAGTPANQPATQAENETIGDWLARQGDFDAGLFGEPAEPEPADAGAAGVGTVGPDGQPWDPQRYMQTLHKVQEEARTAKQHNVALVNALVDAGVIERPADNTPPTPEQLAEQARTATAAARQAQVQLAVYQRAGQHGVDPQRVMGWAPFLQTVSGLDPKAPDFAAQVDAKLAEQVTAAPWLRADGTAATPAPPPASVTTPAPGVSGAAITAGYNPVPLTEADLARMSQPEIAKAFHEGRLRHLQ